MFEVDSTLGHQIACLALKAIGASRDGKNIKIHVLINEKMQFLNVILTGGQIHDSEPALELFSGFKLGGKKILADKAYSSEHIRSYLQEQARLLAFPTK